MKFGENSFPEAQKVARRPQFKYIAVGVACALMIPVISSRRKGEEFLGGTKEPPSALSIAIEGSTP